MSQITTISFTVNRNQLFDTLSKMNGDTSSLGQRLVESLLAEPKFSDQLGMGLYGVTYVPKTEIEIVWTIDRFGVDCAYVGEVKFAELRYSSSRRTHVVIYPMKGSSKNTFDYKIRTNAKKAAEREIRKFFKMLGVD